jgi:uncharacterized protein YbbC (DUF1343 family)/CubicO group peptidase (beta-lactamase class C family)
VRALLCLLTIAGVVAQVPAPESWSGAKAAAHEIERAIAAGRLPGAVLLVGTGARIVHLAAYGNRAEVPARESMTVDTIFDAASLTKIVATTSALMRLYEDGKISIDDPVSKYLPEYTYDITVRQLLTHYSGLRPDVDLKPEWAGYETGVAKAIADKPTGPPNKNFVYSDINFILLGEIVRRVSGEPLPSFVQRTVFQPLGMLDTSFTPSASLRARIAPTEQYPGMSEPLRGVVHDETTRFMSGVAGHAGLFTTASDLSRWCQMLLSQGSYGGRQLFAPQTVALFTSPQSPPGMADIRGLGFDIDSRYSGNRGDLYPPGSGFGHTGFTGTSLWIDPRSNSFVILLANSVHPYRRPAITPLRRRIATITAASFGVRGLPLKPVATGLEMMRRQNFQMLKGKRVGLITNHTGVDAYGRRNVDLMKSADVNVSAIFTPEHGLAGKADHENVPDEIDSATRVPVYSLYKGDQRTPNAEQLSKTDVLVFDIQDIGARFYTYMCNMQNAMREAARLKKPFIVLDRPNPIGDRVEGPVMRPELQSFIGCSQLPLRHGMTIGELAQWMNSEDGIQADLTVVRMEGYRRSSWFDETGLTWVDPSPNMRSLDAAALYPGVAMVELSRNISVGRGTDAPFQQFGAPWIDGVKLAAYLNSRAIPGVSFYPVAFTPAGRELAGQRCGGVRLVILERTALSVSRLGLEVMSALIRLFPGSLNLETNLKLIGDAGVVEKLKNGIDPRVVADDLQQEADEFALRRRPYLLY